MVDVRVWLVVVVDVVVTIALFGVEEMARGFAYGCVVA